MAVQTHIGGNSDYVYSLVEQKVLLEKHNLPKYDDFGLEYGLMRPYIKPEWLIPLIQECQDIVEGKTGLSKEDAIAYIISNYPRKVYAHFDFAPSLIDWDKVSELTKC